MVRNDVDVVVVVVVVVVVFVTFVADVVTTAAVDAIQRDGSSPTRSGADPRSAPFGTNPFAGGPEC